MKKSIIYLFASAVLLTACKKDDPITETCSDCDNDSFLFVSNEGSFSETGSVSKINLTKQTVENDLYANANNSVPVGSVVQSLLLTDEGGYVVTNGSDQIVGYNGSDFSHENAITVSYPRYIASEDDFGYVTSGNYAGKVFKFNLSTGAIVDSVAVGNGPEQLVILDDKIVVCNSGGWDNDSTIAIIDKETFELDSLLEVGSKPTDILEDKNGDLWILASGQYASTKEPQIVQLNSSDWSVTQSIVIGTADQNISKMAINADKDMLVYYKSDGVYKLGVSETSAPSSPLISIGGWYGIEANADLFLFESPDFSSVGKVVQYTIDGDSITEYSVGVGPNGGAFN